MNKKQKLDKLNKELCPSGETIIYDYLEDKEGNPNFLFSWAKNIHISKMKERTNMEKNELNVIRRDMGLVSDKIEEILISAQSSTDAIKDLIIDINKTKFKLEDIEKSLEAFISDSEDK